MGSPQEEQWRISSIVALTASRTFGEEVLGPAPYSAFACFFSR